MKKLFAILPVFLTLPISAEAENGLMFARTLRGNAEISAQSAKIKQGELAVAKDAKISASAEGFASVAFSNYSSCMVLSGKVSIEKFEQEKVQTASLPLYSEMESSNIVFAIDGGEAVFARGEFRPASSFKIKTKFGTIEPVGNNIKIKTDGSTLTARAYDAAIRYSKPGSNEQEYIPIGYDLVCYFENGELKSEKKQSSIPQKASLKSEAGSASDVFKTTEFYRGEDGKICARRIAFKEFFIRTRDPIR